MSTPGTRGQQTRAPPQPSASRVVPLEDASVEGVFLGAELLPCAPVHALWFGGGLHGHGEVVRGPNRHRSVGSSGTAGLPWSYRLSDQEETDRDQPHSVEWGTIWGCCACSFAGIVAVIFTLWFA